MAQLVRASRVVSSVGDFNTVTDQLWLELVIILCFAPSMDDVWAFFYCIHSQCFSLMKIALRHLWRPFWLDMHKVMPPKPTRLSAIREKQIKMETKNAFCL